jgi:hypothetical protein
MTTNNEIIIIFSKNNTSKSGKITNNALKSKIISNLKKAEKLLDEQKFKKLQKDLIIHLKENNTITITIKKNNYKLKIETNDIEENMITNINKIEEVIKDEVQDEVVEEVKEPEKILTENDNEEKILEKQIHEDDNHSLDSTDTTYVLGSDNESDILDYNEDNNSKKYDIVDEQTYLFDADLSDEEESIIDNAIKLKDKYYLKSLNINELRNIMKNKNLKISKNGVYLKKSEMIKKIQKNI